MALRMIMDETVGSQLNLVTGCVAGAVKKLEGLGLDEATLFNVKLCLHEAMVNAVNHGNKSNRDLAVRVVIKADDHEIIIQVTDQGEGFDFSLIPDPTTEENIGKFHGRGIFLIQSTMDSVRFLEGGRTISMAKTFNKGT